MTTTRILTPGELIEQLRSTQPDPFVALTQLPVEDQVSGDSHSVQTYERLREKFDENMRLRVSLQRMAAD